MSNENRKGGRISLKQNGISRDAKGEFTYNLGADKNTAIVGQDGVHGYSSMPQVPYLEGEITDRGDLDVKGLMNSNNETVTLELANGKTVLFREAWWAGEGDITTAEGVISVRWEAIEAEEV